MKNIIEKFTSLFEYRDSVGSIVVYTIVSISIIFGILCIINHK